MEDAENDRLGLLHSPRWVRGPALRNRPCQDEGTALDAFAAELDTPNCRRLFEYWRQRLKAEGDIPVYDTRWWRDLSDIADHLYSREWLPGGTDIRYRYVGHAVEERMGLRLTGKAAGAFNPVSGDALWAINGPTFTEGRALAGQITYRHLGRGHVRGAIVQLPMKDPTSGEIRFSLNAVHYFGPD